MKLPRLGLGPWNNLEEREESNQKTYKITAAHIMLFQSWIQKKININARLCFQSVIQIFATLILFNNCIYFRTNG